MQENYNQAAPEQQNGAARGSAPQAAPRTAQETPQKVRRVGTFAFGLVLIAAGVLAIVHVLAPGLDLIAIVKFAPAVLIVLGVEVLIYAAMPNVKLKYDFLSMFVCCLVLLFIGGASSIGLLWADYGPNRSYAESRLSRQYESLAGQTLQTLPTVKDNISDVGVSVDLNHAISNSEDVTLQSSDHVRLYVSIYPDAYANPQDYASACKAMMDACRTAGLPFNVYQFATSNQGFADDGQTYELNVDGPWRQQASAEALAKSVITEYWYNGDSYSTQEHREQAIQQQRRDKLSESYQDEYGEYPPEEWLSEQLLLSDGMTGDSAASGLAGTAGEAGTEGVSGMEGTAGTAGDTGVAGTPGTPPEAPNAPAAPDAPDAPDAPTNQAA